MLNRYTKINPLLLNRLTAYFGGSSAPVEINIDKNAKWIKYKANRKLACLQGIQDIHIKTPGPIMQYPFEHTKNARFFSEQLFYYNDPWHHGLQFEKHTVGQQGYIEGDDPNDTRYDLIIPGISAALALSFVFFISEFSNVDMFQTMPEKMQQGLNMQRLAGEALSKKAKIIEELERQIQELSKKNNS